MLGQLCWHCGQVAHAFYTDYGKPDSKLPISMESQLEALGFTLDCEKEELEAIEDAKPIESRKRDKSKRIKRR